MCCKLGVLQLGVFFIGRFGRWPLWWGISNLLIGAGTFLIRATGPYASVCLGRARHAVTWMGYVCMLAAVPVFAARP